tara:strand:+ start:530 stop:655 length:126 start_codon:yes stop_codon:yes gene_type:complete
MIFVILINIKEGSDYLLNLDNPIRKAKANGVQILNKNSRSG